VKERLIKLDMTVVSHEQAAEVAKPGERALDLPALAVAPQAAPVVERGLASVLAVRADQRDAPARQAPAQFVAVVSAVGNHPQGAFFWGSAPGERKRYLTERRLGQRHFRRAGAVQSASQRNTLAVDHHHPLCALALLGFSNAGAPFLAGAKLPSKNDSLQSSLPRLSSWRRNSRQTLSQTPRLSHCRKRRQQVLGLGYCAGRSRQRAPVLSTHRIPSRTRRLSAQGRPLLRSLGRSGWMAFHCSSVKNAFCIASFSHIPSQKAPKKYKILQRYLMKPLLGN